jgi:integrase
VGGGQEALIGENEKTATTDPDAAAQLAAARLRELEAKRRGKNLIGVVREESLHAFAAHHLQEKAKLIRTGKITESWVAANEKFLAAAIKYFSDVDVASITPAHVQSYAEFLASAPNGRESTKSEGTQRHYLNALSNLFQRAQADGLVPAGYNPVAALMNKPSAAADEAHWLEVPDAALLLEAARTNSLKRPDVANPNLHELLATFLFTGGRASEVYGLDVADVSFDRRIIHFRPNRWRRLKTKTSRRILPLWPQLEEILRPYVFGGRAPRSGLLFPSPKTGRLITDIRKALGTLAERAGLDGPELRTKAFRHTYCAARLQTLDRGAPVSPWTVVKEMGHGGRELVDRVYGHLGMIGDRTEVVEYRVDSYLDLIGTQVADLRAGIY